MVLKNRTLSTQKSRLSRHRLALGFAGALSAAVIGSAGVAAAHPAAQQMYLPSRQACASEWHALKFKNAGACQSYWDQHKPKQHQPGNPNQGNGSSGNTASAGGSGYGGGGPSTGITVNVNGGSGNVITIIINYFR